MESSKAEAKPAQILRAVLTYLKENKALPALLLFIVVASFAFDTFFTPINLKNVFRQVSMLGMVSIGMTLVMLGGGIDLSVGSVAAVASILATYLCERSAGVAMFVPLLVGMTFGLCNGLIITRLRIPPFIATLATMLGARGLAFVISHGETVRPTSPDPTFSKLARGSVLEIPYLGILFIVATAIFVVVLGSSSFGRRVYAVGGNEEAAKMMGLKVNPTKVWTYVLSGLMAGLAGVLLASRLGSGQPYAGGGWELTAIAAVVIGGTRTSGGVGTVMGTLYGVFIIGVITNMVNLFGNLPYWYSNLVTALLLLVVILVQSKRATTV